MRAGLKQRLRTVLVGAPVLVGIVYVGGWWFWGLVAGLALLAEVELCGLLGRRDLRVRWWAVVAVTWAVLVWVQLRGEGALPQALLGAVALGLAGVWLSRQGVWGGWGHAAALLYAGVPWAFLLLLRLAPEGVLRTLAVLATVWAGDAGAYFVGRAFGRRGLVPRISPAKTVEGALGGVAGAVAVGMASGVALHLGWPAGLGLGLLAAVVGQAGDLLESALKRWAGVKDSGQLLPGHGGILDRMDSVLLALPAVYYYLQGVSGHP